MVFPLEIINNVHIRGSMGNFQATSDGGHRDYNSSHVTSSNTSGGGGGGALRKSHFNLMLFQRWVGVWDARPTLEQHRVDVSRMPRDYLDDYN